MIPFEDPEPLKLNAARLVHLAGLGLDLSQPTVLEPGAGIGLLTRFWEERGAAVTSLDLQQANVDENLARNPRRKVLCRGVEQGFADLGPFHIVFCYGLLYHVADPEKCLRELCRVCLNLLLLETMVYPVDDGKLHAYPQVHGPDQGQAGPVYRPARDWVMRVLREEFGQAYVSRTQPNYMDFPLVWPAPVDSVCRSIFVGSRTTLNLPTLLTDLPTSQYRFIQ